MGYSANILLDSALEPRIGDFGLAREGPQSSQYTHVKVSRVHGTRPYLPDEFLRYKKLSTKVDTYSFGVVSFITCSDMKFFGCEKVGLSIFGQGKPGNISLLFVWKSQKIAFSLGKVTFFF